MKVSVVMATYNGEKYIKAVSYTHLFREKDFLEKSLCLGTDSHLYGVCVADHHSDQRKLRAVQDESCTAEQMCIRDSP